MIRTARVTGSNMKAAKTKWLIACLFHVQSMLYTLSV